MVEISTKKDDFFSENAGRSIIIFLVLLYTFLLIKTAWVTEDAYITFRTIDNFTKGYGLTWNITERVQCYTHPLWMFLVTCFYFFTKEAFFTNIYLSIIISILAVLIFSFKNSLSRLSIIAGLTVLIFSRAFIDYSTSGLENPLTHLLLTIFLCIYFREKHNAKTLFYLSLLTGLSTLNRMDIFLLVFPALFYRIIKSWSFKNFSLVIAGFSPFILWEVFSLFYYGFLFPNTAYAKLNTGISSIDLSQQGIFYFFDSINRDPLTLLIIIFTLIASFLHKKRNIQFLSLGIVLYLFYLLRVGGDFMSGRFLSAPFFCSVFLFSRLDYLFENVKYMLAILILVIIVGFSSPQPTLVSHATHALNRQNTINKQGIGDERRVYFEAAGLLNSRKNRLMPYYPSAVRGDYLKSTNKSVYVADYVGYLGFFAGQNIHIIDRLAICDPLLSRLPAKYNPNWRIGHFLRTIPENYIETLLTGKNLLKDSKLAKFYQKLKVVTRGPLFSKTRLKEIWNFSIGKYKKLIDHEFYRKSLTQPNYSGLYVHYSEIAVSKEKGTPWNKTNNYFIPREGIAVYLPKTYYSKKIEMSIHTKGKYFLAYYLNGQKIHKQEHLVSTNITGRLDIIYLSIPKDVSTSGYDLIKLIPEKESFSSSLGHLKLLD